MTDPERRNGKNRHGGHDDGFSLIELMIVVVVLGIIVAVAYPSYQQHVFESRRTDAKAALLDGAQRLERCYGDSLAYDGGACGSVTSGLGQSPEGYYNIAASNLSATAFTLTATATGPQSGDGECRTMAVDESGNRTAKAADGSDTSGECW